MIEQRFVNVAIQTPLYNTFDYLWPFNEDPIIGGRVVIPFGRQTKVGIILSHSDKTDIPTTKIKAIKSIIDSSPVFDKDMLKMLFFASQYYQHPKGEVLFHALPLLLREGKPNELKKETVKICRLIESYSSNHSFAIEAEQLETRIADADLLNRELKRAPKQKNLYELLKNSSFPSIELKELGHSTATINALKAKGIIEEVAIEVAPSEYPADAHWTKTYSGANNALTLNKEQATAVGVIATLKENFNTWLIEGITGSGKTEVYLHLIDTVLKAGKQVLVLIPEIGLTPQTISRFNARFSVPIAMLHSKLNDNARLKAWQQAKSGDIAIVIGTRSSVFTPFKNLGLIIIDEEHDSSYKQQEGFRYHARDIAITRAKPLNIPVILGTATPSLETLHNTKIGKFKLLSLTKRAGNASLPKQHLIDLKNQPLEAGLSHPLIQVMRTHLASNNQVLLFLNRRGYAPALLCHECGWIAECRHCEKSYTLHQAINKLRCHHCDHQIKTPVQCYSCGSTQLMPAGIGTEQLEEKLTQLFPGVPISRIDRDTVSKKGELEDELELINQGGRRIIVGTQMLAKGHHFSDVTLVALLDVDGALFSADFRSAEHFGQLFTQVSGRAGRASKPGTVYLQTHHPEHPWLTMLFKEGYKGLSEMLLKEREETLLPPFSHLACLRAESIQSQLANQFLMAIKNELKASPYFDNNLWILGPVPSLLAKRQGRFRWQLLIQHKDRQKLHQQLNLLNAILSHQTTGNKLRWSLDIDPLDN
ncbi:primosomal protein N' [Thorsellia kenyensis]|uniref:Replication restart protein PriA n=1 Tax=Thorsellia kenyensis TaxID=1549888 RepID=A0ABV6CDD5_9GAMM